MLRELRIRDMAIIEDLCVEFTPGLNVLSGETGAGKSIVVDALDLALGGRGSGDLVRAGAETALVEAVFDLSRRSDARERLAGLGLEAGDELVVRRVLAPGSKGKIHVNGGAVTQGMLAQATEALVEIHGQHEHQRLLRRELHLEVLDRAAGLLPLCARVAETARRARELVRERDALRMSEDDRLRQIDYLRFQVNEIRGADLQPGEEERLVSERARLTHAARLAEIAAGAEAGLYSGEGAAVDTLGRVVAALREGARLDASLGEVAERIEGILREAEDAATTLRDYAREAVLDPERLEALEVRLETVRKLTRKYGPDVDGVLHTLASAQESLAALEGHDERLASIEAQCAAVVAQGGALAEELSSKRKRASQGLARKVCKELEALGLARAVFQVPVTGETFAFPGFGEQGRDRVEFLFSSNPGEPPRALARIASGGELARTMLAIQNVLAASDLPSTLVFDEADAGVGGRVADAVGQRLSDLAATHQVLCITHLPQIAARGARHLRVWKEARQGRTIARVEALVGDDRVEEIARMSGGATITQTTRAHARELLARSARQTIR